MLLAVVWTKGSQGKSSISQAIAYETGFGIITNDIDSSVDEFLPEERVIKLRNEDPFPEIPKNMGVVMDAKAGVDEPVVLEAIKKADWVIIPTIYGVEELKRSIRAIKHVSQYNEKIVIVANAMSSEQYKEVKEIIKDVADHPIFHIRNSRYVGELLFIPESIKDKSKRGGLVAYQMKDIVIQFEALFQHLGLK